MEELYRSQPKPEAVEIKNNGGIKNLVASNSGEPVAVKIKKEKILYRLLSFNIQNIPIHEIGIDPLRIDPERVDGIVEAFDVRVADPPKVYSKGDRWECFDGIHVVEAAKRLDYTHIDCIVVYV